MIITTTNYDQIIEESIQIDSDHYNLLNGFKHYGQKLFFDNKHFNEIDENRRNITLLKLHGSLDWKLDKNNNKIRISSEVKDDSPYIRNMLIYPTLNIKERKEEPFISLINRFEEFLKSSDIFIVIGFSFRDQYLVNYIKLHFKNKLLIIVDPSPFEGLKNFLQLNNKDIKGIKLQDIGLIFLSKR